MKSDVALIVLLSSLSHNQVIKPEAESQFRIPCDG